MAIPLQTIRQRDWSAGELDPNAERREDRDEFKYGVKYARNLRTNKAGNLIRRGARKYLYSDTGRRDEFKPFGATQYSVTFTTGKVIVRLQSGTKAATLTAPWGASDIDTLHWEFYENQIFVTWGGRPQVITIDEATNAWSIADFTFGAGIGDEVAVPFHRFKADGSTLLPSDDTGDIDVEFSVDLLTADHVGAVFTYSGRQLKITGVTDARNGTATVLQKLPPTWRIYLETNAANAGFEVGASVECTGFGMKGEVVDVDGDYINVAAENFNNPKPGDERIISPIANTEVRGAQKVTLAATTRWEEQFMSDARGWPRSVSKDAQRLIFTDFPQYKQAILWSAISEPDNMLVTGEASGAILEFVGADCQVYHVIGGYDEFAITDIGVFYIPISTSTPLAPGSVEFRRVSSDEVANVRPVQVTEGVLFVDSSRTGIYSIAATGQTARPYLSTEITDLHRHLFNEIKEISVRAGTATFPAREIFAVNGDGTVVAGQYNESRQYVGWLKWDNGFVQSVSSRYGSVIFTTKYTLAGGNLTVAESLLDDGFLDCSVSFGSTDLLQPLTLDSGDALELAGGGNLEISQGVATIFKNRTVDVMVDGFYAGKVAIPANGQLTGFSSYDTVTIGIKNDWSLKPLLEAFEGGESFGQRERKRKIAMALIKVKDTQQFRVGGRIFGSYRGGEDMTVPLPKRDDVYKAKPQGRSYDPEYTIETTDVPGTFQLVELTTKVTV